MNLSICLPDAYDFVDAHGEHVGLRLECFNSVDGSSRLIIIFGWLRFVCTNGLIIGDTKIEIKERHAGGLDLEYTSKRIQPALNAALEDRARMMRWQSQKVAINAVADWADDRLSAQWGKKAAARVFNICASGNDVEIDDPFAPGPASKKPIRYLSAVPGAPARASTKYDVAQAMSFVATRRKNMEERYAWQDEIPGLLEQLSAVRRHPTVREGSEQAASLYPHLAGLHNAQAPPSKARPGETSSEQLTLMLPMSGIADSSSTGNDNYGSLR
jgi:hypothetical protein